MEERDKHMICLVLIPFFNPYFPRNALLCIYASDFTSMTNRYFTSLFTTRS